MYMKHRRRLSFVLLGMMEGQLQVSISTDQLSVWGKTMGVESRIRRGAGRNEPSSQDCGY
jgi:hypothetical protein